MLQKDNAQIGGRFFQKLNIFSAYFLFFTRKIEGCLECFMPAQFLLGTTERMSTTSALTLLHINVRSLMSDHF
tara:strand:+ start:239 stop:457 length:219 start_codon:yes stop_codon:yes gene_type:complete